MFPNIPMMLNGMPVVLDKKLGKEVQSRTHRKKRINKKWSKRYGVRFVPDRNCYVFDSPYGGKQIIMHPTVWEVVRLEIGQ